MARPWTLVWWELLRTGSTWSPRHPTSHTTRHAARDSTWDVALHVALHVTLHVTLHAGRNPSRYTARNVSDWRATRWILLNLLSGFLSSDEYRRKVGGLEGV